MLNWTFKNKTEFLHEKDLALNNLQMLICHKIQPINHNIVSKFKFLSKFNSEHIPLNKYKY